MPGGKKRRLHPVTLAVGSSASAEGGVLETLWRDRAALPKWSDVSTKSATVLREQINYALTHFLAADDSDDPGRKPFLSLRLHCLRGS